MIFQYVKIIIYYKAMNLDQTRNSLFTGNVL